MLRRHGRGAFARFGVLFIAASVILVLAIILIVPYLTTASSQGAANQRRLIVVDSHSIAHSSIDSSIGQPITTFEQTYDFHYVKVGDLNPNTAVWALYPFDSVVDTLYQKPLSSLDVQQSKDIYARIDKFAFYQLVRLPAWLGGNENTSSAFRAFNAVTPSVKCLVRYWPDQGRHRLEDPCAGDMYRPWDGLAIAGPFSVGVSSGVASATNAQGLPTLELSIDSEGYIVAHRPDASPDKNGVAGEGKVFSGAELQASNSAMIGAASRYAGYELPFIAQVPLGNSLKVLEPTFFTGDYLQGKTSHSQMQASYSYLLPYLTIESALIDSVPQLNFSGSTVTLKNGTVLPNLNNRLVSEILELPATSNAGSDGNCYHYYTSVDAKSGSEKVVPYSLKAGSGIAGTFAAFYAPDPTCAPEGRGLAKPDANAQNDRFDGNSDALVWGKSEGGQNIIVHVHAFNYTIDRLVELVQSLPIK